MTLKWLANQANKQPAANADAKSGLIAESAGKEESQTPMPSIKTKKTRLPKLNKRRVVRAAEPGKRFKICSSPF